MSCKVIDEAIKFQVDRGLDKQEFDEDVSITNIMQEFLELLGLTVPKEKRNHLNIVTKSFILILIKNNIITKAEEPTEITRVDALNDIIELCIGDILKLGYDPELTLNEVNKEINSRKGKIINGKFEKDVNQDPATLYKADFSKCKRSK